MSPILFKVSDKNTNYFIVKDQKHPPYLEYTPPSVKMSVFIKILFFVLKIKILHSFDKPSAIRYTLIK